MDTQTQQLLAQLKDIHTPPPIPFWPLATGWYILLFLAVLGLLIFAYGFYRWMKHYRYRQRILMQVKALKTQVTPNANQQEILAALSILLKQVLLTRYDRTFIGGLYGEAWLSCLDTVSRTKSYTQGEGRLLLTGPYAPNHTTELAQLFPLIEKTIKRCLS
jgi:predicted histidine transporter YuiF (NhaC family)